MNMEIASIIFEICIVLEPATTSGTGLLLDRDTGSRKRIATQHLRVPSPMIGQYTLDSSVNLTRDTGATV